MLLTFLTEHQADIVAALTARIRKVAPAYRSMPEHELSISVQKGIETGLAILRSNDMHILDRFMATTVAARLPDRFSTLLVVFGLHGLRRAHPVHPPTVSWRQRRTHRCRSATPAYTERHHAQPPRAALRGASAATRAATTGAVASVQRPVRTTTRAGG